MIVMVDETTGDRYARMTGAKGIGENQERDWLVKDMSEELKDWGHTGGEAGHIILKCDSEKIALKSVLWQCIRQVSSRGHGVRDIKRFLFTVNLHNSPMGK